MEQFLIMPLKLIETTPKYAEKIVDELIPGDHEYHESKT